VTEKRLTGRQICALSDEARELYFRSLRGKIRQRAIRMWINASSAIEFEAMPPEEQDRVLKMFPGLEINSMQSQILKAGNGDAEVGYRILAKKFHPDHGGTNEQMSELNAAIAALRVKV